MGGITFHSYLSFQTTFPRKQVDARQRESPRLLQG